MSDTLVTLKARQSLPEFHCDLSVDSRWTIVANFRRLPTGDIGQDDTPSMFRNELEP